MFSSVEKLQPQISGMDDSDAVLPLITASPPCPTHMPSQVKTYSRETAFTTKNPPTPVPLEDFDMRYATTYYLFII